jgi:hypothetical protein
MPRMDIFGARLREDTYGLGAFFKACTKNIHSWHAIYIFRWLRQLMLKKDYE